MHSTGAKAKFEQWCIKLVTYLKNKNVPSGFSIFQDLFNRISKGTLDKRVTWNTNYQSMAQWRCTNMDWTVPTPSPCPQLEVQNKTNKKRNKERSYSYTTLV